MRSRLHAVSWILLYALISGALFFSGGKSVGADLQLWPDWYTLVCRDSAKVEAMLPETLTVLSPRTAEVEISGFDRMITLPLAEIPHRLSSLDPRVDPFIRALPRMFRGSWNGEGAELLYVERNMPLRDFQEILNQAGIGTDIALLADAGMTTPLRDTLLFLAALLAVLLVLPSFRILSFLVLLPWGIGLFVSGPEALYLVLLGVFSIPAMINILMPLMLRRIHDSEQSLSRSQRSELIILAAGLVLAMAFYGFYVSFTDFLRFPFSAALAGLALIRGRLMFRVSRTGRMLHPLFVHISLKPQGLRFRRYSLQTAAVGVAMLVAFLPFAGGHQEDLRLPLAENLESVSENPMDNLSMLDQLEKETGLPGLSSYMVHKFFQENYLYHPGFSLDALEKGIFINSFVHKKNHINELDRPIWRFTYPWYTAIIGDDTDRISNFFLQDGTPKGILNRAVSFGKAPVYGVYPGFALLLTLMFIGLAHVLEEKRRVITHFNGSYESRRMSQTA